VEPNINYREEWERFRPDGGHVVGVTGTTHTLYLCSYYEYSILIVIVFYVLCVVCSIGCTGDGTNDAPALKVREAR
jgi:hypothetical protein